MYNCVYKSRNRFIPLVLWRLRYTLVLCHCFLGRSKSGEFFREHFYYVGSLLEDLDPQDRIRSPYGTMPPAEIKLSVSEIHILCRYFESYCKSTSFNVA